ncbi:MAG: hypothetical protein KDA62_14650 [Planctomycetales bacterium]|nr:hypothetical protein [Planctomycetales bacterium]
MARDSFLLRLDPKLLDALRRWANDELRSVNGQVEFLLRQALHEAGRLPEGAATRTNRVRTPPNQPPDDNKESTGMD